MEKLAAPRTDADRGVLRRALVVVALTALGAAVVAARVPICPMAAVLGLPCPGCGLTRATLALLRGDVRQALHLHPLVFVIAPLFSWAMLSAGLSYVRGPAPKPKLKPWLASRAVTALGCVLLVATLGVWGARFFGYFGGPVPVETFTAWAAERRAGVAPRR